MRGGEGDRDRRRSKSRENGIRCLEFFYIPVPVTSPAVELSYSLNQTGEINNCEVAHSARLLRVLYFILIVAPLLFVNMSVSE